MKQKSSKPLEGEIIRPERHTKYNPSMCQTIINVAEQGGHIPAMCVAIGIRSKDTFFRWRKLYPEFEEAYQAAVLISQKVYEEIGFAGMMGRIKGFNFNSFAMIMNNKFPDEYKRSATGSNTEINVGSINSIEQLSSTELDKKIELLQKKLNLIPSEVKDENGS